MANNWLVELSLFDHKFVNWVENMVIFAKCEFQNVGVLSRTSLILSFVISSCWNLAVFLINVSSIFSYVPRFYNLIVDHVIGYFIGVAFLNVLSIYVFGFVLIVCLFLTFVVIVIFSPGVTYVLRGWDYP